jgi:hypothetical protein
MAGGVERAGSAMIPFISELSTPLNCRPAESDLVSDGAGVGIDLQLAVQTSERSGPGKGQRSDAAQTGSLAVSGTPAGPADSANGRRGDLPAIGEADERAERGLVPLRSDAGRVRSPAVSGTPAGPADSANGRLDYHPSIGDVNERAERPFLGQRSDAAQTGSLAVSGTPAVAGGLRERPTGRPPRNQRCKPASGAALFGPAERCGPGAKSRSERDAGCCRRTPRTADGETSPQSAMQTSERSGPFRASGAMRPPHGRPPAIGGALDPWAGAGLQSPTSGADSSRPVPSGAVAGCEAERPRHSESTSNRRSPRPAITNQRAERPFLGQQSDAAWPWRPPFNQRSLQPPITNAE